MVDHPGTCCPCLPGVGAHNQIDEALPGCVAVGDGRNWSLVGMAMIEADDGSLTRRCHIVGFEQRCGIKHITVVCAEDIDAWYDTIDDDNGCSPCAEQDAADLAIGLLDRMVP